MYKIFVGDKPIILTSVEEEEAGFKNYDLKTVSIHEVIKTLGKKKISEVRLIYKNEQKLLKKFLKKLPNVVAGGGKVYNEKNDILFIFRNGKWDLPKGKAEKWETIEETSIREVAEETGVTGLEIIKPLETTYHIFKRNGRYRVKITYWFEMKTTYSGPLIAQEIEGITKVKWLKDKKVKKALENSYSNIKLLM